METRIIKAAFLHGDAVADSEFYGYAKGILDERRELWRRHEAGTLRYDWATVGVLTAHRGTRFLTEEGGLGKTHDNPVSAGLNACIWAEQMDVTRLSFPPDGDVGEVTYVHFVLSLHPHKYPLVKVAREWAKASFRTEERVHEYRIEFHHRGFEVFEADVIVNAVNLVDGSRLVLDSTTMRELERSAGEALEAAEPGLLRTLTAIPKPGPGSVAASPADAGRALSGDPAPLWRLRRTVSAVSPLSRDFGDFQRKMRAAGWDVARDGGDLSYSNRFGLRADSRQLGPRFGLGCLECAFTHEPLSEGFDIRWRFDAQAAKGPAPGEDAVADAVRGLWGVVTGFPGMPAMPEEPVGETLLESSTRKMGGRLRPSRRGSRDALLGALLVSPSLGRSAGGRAMRALRLFPATGGGERDDPGFLMALHGLAALMARRGAFGIEDLACDLRERRRRLDEDFADLSEMWEAVNGLYVILHRASLDGRESAELRRKMLAYRDRVMDDHVGVEHLLFRDETALWSYVIVEAVDPRELVEASSIASAHGIGSCPQLEEALARIRRELADVEARFERCEYLSYPYREAEKERKGLTGALSEMELLFGACEKAARAIKALAQGAPSL